MAFIAPSGRTTDSCTQVVTVCMGLAMMEHGNSSRWCHVASCAILSVMFHRAGTVRVYETDRNSIIEWHRIDPCELDARVDLPQEAQEEDDRQQFV